MLLCCLDVHSRSVASLHPERGCQNLTPHLRGPALTVPLLARCVGQSSGDELISPELPA